MRWEGRRQSDNIEDRRGMRISRGGLVGGGLGTIAVTGGSSLPAIRTRPSGASRPA